MRTYVPLNRFGYWWYEYQIPLFFNLIHFPVSYSMNSKNYSVFSNEFWLLMIHWWTIIRRLVWKIYYQQIQISVKSYLAKHVFYIISRLIWNSSFPRVQVSLDISIFVTFWNNLELIWSISTLCWYLTIVAARMSLKCKSILQITLAR